MKILNRKQDIDILLGLPYNIFKRGSIVNTLSASLEDYIEIIWNLYEKNDTVKAIDIAKELNVSRASVSEALVKLAEKNLIINEGHKGIKITEKGILKAQEVTSKHRTLTSFLENTLGIDKHIAENNACKIEHVISADVFARIEAFQKFCNDRNEYIDEFKKGYIKK